MTEPGAEEEEVRLDEEELAFLRFVSNIHPEEESPLSTVRPRPSEEVLRRAAAQLQTRGLLRLEGLRPNRELLRRLLIVSEPDARIVLFRSGPDGGRRELDVYQRAGACVPVRHEPGHFTLGATVELGHIFESLVSRFTPRRSRGDFIDLELDAKEYFAFAVLANDIADRRDKTNPNLEIADTDPAEQRFDTDQVATLEVAPNPPATPISTSLGDEGTPIHSILRSLPPASGSHPSLPSMNDWDDALASLIAKDLIYPERDRHVLRPFLRDLAIGLARKRRTVVTRFDFGEEDWFVRDATLIVVPGSIFAVRAADRAIRIEELDEDRFAVLIQNTIDDVPQSNM